MQFKCDEDTSRESMCIFHNKDYLKDKDCMAGMRKQTVEQKVMQKLEDSIDNNTDLFCIGYHLPGLQIVSTFAKPVYFSSAVLPW